MANASSSAMAKLNRAWMFADPSGGPHALLGLAGEPLQVDRARARSSAPAGSR